MIPFWFRRRRYFRYTRHVAGAIRRRLWRVVALFIGLFVVHVLAMVGFEGFDALQAIWLTLTTATTVGYGDISAETPWGRLATIACMYTFGIFLLAQAVSDLFDYRALQRERRRRGEFKWKNMKDHLLIVNVPAQDADIYLTRLIDSVRRTPALDDIPVQLLTPRYRDGLPAELVNAGVTHYSDVAESSDSLEAANAISAHYIMVIADETYDARSDSHTYDILSRIRQLAERGARERSPVIVAEVVDDANRERILAAGATTVMRPMRAYPELAVRALVAPGVEQVLETLFTHEDDRLVRFDVPFENLRWSDVVVGFVRADAGIPMGYIDAQGVHTNPPPSAVCGGSAVIALVDESLDVSPTKVATCLAAAPAAAA